MSNPKQVKSGAEKRFFIDMLTKDIELLPAIADLVDNSVDGVRHLASDSDLEGYWVAIDVDGAGFEIRDNAGGISTDIARNYAFHFGRPAEFQGVPGSVGQFGIGMKRAIFKLGTAFEVESNWASQGGETQTHFLVKESVSKWAARGDDWSFSFAELDENIKQQNADPTGTRIKVSPLHRSVAEDLADDSVVQQLKNELAIRHQQSILNGLKVTVNGGRLKAHRPILQSSDEFAPINYSFVVDAEVEGYSGKVHVKLTAGTVAPPSAQKDLDDGQASNFTNTGEAGWYVFCNDRLLLAADRSSFTGWGSTAAAYHPQYRNFRGYVYMESEDARFLPWNTTKTAVDRDSAVFREVATKMKVALVDVQALINRAKIERERVKSLDEAGIEDYTSPKLSSAMDVTRNLPLESIPTSRVLVAPEPAALPPIPRPGPTTQRIQYQVEIDRYQKLSTLFGTNNGSALGRATFDYVWKAEVSE
ncbi:ATP-binding protein [Microbacterium testaceum]|uniref:ATP-binding protein n=1 Tax=Microbacterium testaceum TaxID=2033 RepID=UPI002434A5AA|nr:ATP-binding protein [Microbacterium testaceum]